MIYKFSGINNTSEYNQIITLVSDIPIHHKINFSDLLNSGSYYHGCRNEW